MEMRAVKDVAMGQDLTPPIPPIAAALHDSRRSSHCSACFSLLPSVPTFFPTTHHVPAPFLRYCSPRCSYLDSPIHCSSAEFQLLRYSSAIPETSDLRLSLRLLRRFQILRLVSENDGVLDRIGGLMTNRAELLMMVESREDSVANEVFEKIKEGARAMAAARRMLLNSESPMAGACDLEEAMLCLVLTNAVEVQDSAGCSVGVAVYGQSFSWINHGCSPNCSYRFSTVPGSISNTPWRIHPEYTDGDGGNGSEPINTSINLKFLSGSEEECGPRLIVRSIKDIKKGEEVLITYTDLLQPKGMRQSELWLKYRFRCCCDRCNAETYVDHILEELSFRNLECSSLTTSGKFNWDFTMEKLVEWFDDAVDDFLTSSNPISCSSKLENLLTYGHPIEDESNFLLKLHPFHHLSLNAYTVLAAAYKALASDEPLPSNHGNDMSRVKSLGFSRASAGYSLLLAGSAHHLFLFEPSLIVSAATFWTAAGESLLSLVTELVPFSSQSCDKCTFHKHDLNVELQEITRQFMTCITDLTPSVWHVLSEEGPFLKVVKDPIDFKWMGSTEFSVLAPPVQFSTSFELKSSLETEGVDLNHVRTCLFQVGLHCSLYGSILSSIWSSS